ncbi:FAD-dependent oxidoreductase [Paenibacillus agricola]|uniref:FAD-dependent oxidoreductase n=1 Tax=Paenibacillus agricola TaxID=2716264 RepID=A0ABX0J187_9BACL|nr:FAD-dependent oxidoreductase [Paenibacillus agricola]NHN29601.1 FAD-dependent oxidoreductase [Paenibacillus agricola]
MDISRLYKGQAVRKPFSGQADQQFDVIVVGLGTAGAVSVVAAAQKGLRVLGIERLTSMGGTGTVGSVLGYYFGSKGGLCESIDDQSLELEKQHIYTASKGVNGDTKKYVFEQEALKAGATLHFDSTVTGVLLEGKKVRGIEWFSPEGRFTAESAIVIDGTGDADVCVMAGCELRGGRDFDGQAQPYSNVYVHLEQGRVAYRYTDSGYVDPRDAVSVSEAIVSSATLRTHLRPVYEDQNRMLRIAPLLGIREGRFILGEDNVTLEGFLNEQYSKEPAFFAYSNADNHSKDLAFESEFQQRWTVASSMWGFNFTVPVPLGALIPVGFDGLLVAGRCLAVDHDMAACVRMKRDMQKCGEAAAYAAYLSVHLQLPLKDVPYTELTALLRETGCLSEKDEVRFKETLSHADETNPIVSWLTNPEEIKTGLSGIKPGLAIWSAFRLKSSMAPQLEQWALQTEQEHLRKHSAFALAMLGNAKAAPVLRETVREKDPFVPKTSRKYNQVRGYAAIFLLGLLGDKEIIPELVSILKEEPGKWTYEDENKEFLADANELYFQYVSFTIIALARIGESHPECREEISEGYRHLLGRSGLKLAVTFKGSTDIKFDMNAKISKMIDETLQRWGAAVSV